MEQEASLPTMGRIPVKNGKKFIFLKPEEIECIEAVRNYIRIQSGGELFLLRQSMAAIEEKLQNSRIIRINRSAMVNIDHIKELRYDDAYHYEVVMDCGKCWIWGRKFRHNLQRVLAS
ncbi:MAG: LytTR family DNA-binding domain-containing protein [Chrysiogenia bacterium]